MPEWLQITIAILTIIGSVSAIIVGIYKLIKKVDIVINRPYPCDYVCKMGKELSERQDRQHKCLEKDYKAINENRKEIELLRKDVDVNNHNLIECREAIRGVDKKVDKVLFLLADKD